MSRAESVEDVGAQEVVERVEPVGRISASDADAEAVGWDFGELGVVDVGGEQQHAGGLDKAPVEAAGGLAGEQAREADAAALWVLPGEVLRPGGEERVEDGQVGRDDVAVALADALGGSEGDRGEVLARDGVADRGVVLAAL